MNILTQTNIKTMSSLEIAAITNKKHAHVLRDIRSMVEQIGNPKLDYEQYQVVTDSHTHRTSEIKLDKNLTLTLITGYDAGLRYSITKRWDELEKSVSQPAVSLPDFTNPAAAARAWADEVESKQMAQEQLSIAAPKAAALDTLSHAKGSLGIRETANTVGIPERKFIARCTDENKPISSRFMYRDDKNKLRAYAHRIKQGFMTQKITSYAGRGGKDIVTVQVKFTAAGVAHIAKLMQNKPVNNLRVLEAV